MIPLYQKCQIRDLERLAREMGVDDDELMRRAGKVAFNAILVRWPNIKAITVCCGKGNNGGDGFVIAQLALAHGLEVNVYFVGQPDQLKGAAAKAAKYCRVPLQPFSYPFDFKSDLIVDALLGIGLVGDVKSPYTEIIQAINEAPQPKFSVDVPSGINSDTGAVQGIAVKADLTVTFMAPKQGLYTNQAPTYCGQLLCDTLGLPTSLLHQVDTAISLMDWQSIRFLLPKRRRDSHKGSFGHVLVIGGDYGMGGAVRMAAEAAARVGAGLVTVATRPEHISVVSSRPEIMCHQIAKVEDLDPLIQRATVVVIGPGLGKTDWSKSLLNKVLETKLPKILDAGALNLLSEYPHTQRKDWILTPHPGEASRLLATSCQDVQQDRFKTVSQLQKKYQGVVVLKGAGTLIKGDAEEIQVCPAGNPGMASGGMGDVLSGVIGGLVAQRLSLSEAARLGVMIHSLAADDAAEEGGERGLLACDLFPHIRRLANPLTKAVR